MLRSTILIAFIVAACSGPVDGGHGHLHRLHGLYSRQQPQKRDTSLTSTSTPTSSGASVSSSMSSISSVVGSSASSAIVVSLSSTPTFALGASSSATSSSVLAMSPSSTVSSILVTSPSSTIVPQTFDPLASDNMAVYIGHSPGNFNASLPALCNDTSINIVMISFIRKFNGLNLLPTFDFAPKCDSRQVTNYSAPFSCPMLADQISMCQDQEKKIFVSIGGSTSNTTFSSEQSAIDAANTLWNVFGSGTATLSIRPFGNVTVDGFDIDQESGPTSYFDTFASTLRSHYPTGDKQYFISAAPLCANTTAVMPSDFYSSTDFVWVRFYDAKKCNVGTTGFIPSVKAWDSYLTSIVGRKSAYPRLYIGGLSFDNGVSGYIPPGNFSDAVQQASVATQNRFGGVMLWDGTNGETTLGVNGETFIEITKQAMSAGSARKPGGSGSGKSCPA